MLRSAAQPAWLWVLYVRDDSPSALDEENRLLKFEPAR
jgi:hypothetical protein